MSTNPNLDAILAQAEQLKSRRRAPVSAAPAPQAARPAPAAKPTTTPPASAPPASAPTTTMADNAAPTQEEKKSPASKLPQLLSGVHASGTSHEVRALMNSIKVHGPLYRAALYEHGEPDAKRRAAHLVESLFSLVEKTMSAGGIDPNNPDNVWMKSTLSGAMSQLVADDWARHGRVDIDRLITITHELATVDSLVGTIDYPDRSAQCEVIMSRTAAVGRALNRLLSVNALMLAHAQKIAYTIDDAVASHKKLLLQALPDPKQMDPMVVECALYREAGEFMGTIGGMFATQENARIREMTTEQKRAYLKENGGQIAINPAIDRFQEVFSSLVSHGLEVRQAERSTQQRGGGTTPAAPTQTSAPTQRPGPRPVPRSTAPAPKPAQRAKPVPGGPSYAVDGLDEDPAPGMAGLR